MIVAATASAGLWGRGKVVSVWTTAAVTDAAATSGWTQGGSYEESGMGLRAFNDASRLTLLVSASARAGRDRLNGDARQDVELWFLLPDARKRGWGMRLPYSRGEEAGPELLASSGTVVSSSTWPAELGFRMLHVGRRPVWEVLTPLARLSPDAGGAVAFDLVFIGTGRTREEIVLERERTSDDEERPRSRRRDRRSSSDLDDPVREMGPSALRLLLIPAEPPMRKP